MKILLVANYKPDEQRSMARYAELLYAELQKRGHEAEVIHPAVIATRLVSRGNRLFRWLAYVDKFILFPPVLWLRARHADVVHVCDHSNSFYLRWTGKTPNVITAHDALAIRSALGHFPQNPTRASGVILQKFILRNLARADWIACVSEKTRRDFEALLTAKSRLCVIRNPPDRSFRPARGEDVRSVRDALGMGPGDEYLLHVGNDCWYKNRPGVLSITAELRKSARFSGVKLVMAGAPLPPELREKAEALGGVVELTGPSDERLRALYTGALALLFPSFEEGFGWPILEAQACVCAVITSERSPMMDVAGGAAILIDPEDAASAARVIVKRAGELDTLRQAGLANVRGYSIDNTMHRYCQMYEELVSARKRGSGKLQAAV